MARLFLNMVSRHRALAFLGGIFTMPLTAHTQSLFTKPTPQAAKLIAAAQSQIGKTLTYDPAYTSIAYPMGDVAFEKGVCTDVIIRAYLQALGIDLQQLVHEDMAQNFSAYPQSWGLTHPNTNIDHRRVPNLRMFFKRQAAVLPNSANAAEHRPGDIISVELPGHLSHITLVTHLANAEGTRPLCIHNIGGGTQMEDMLFTFAHTGHYRYQL